MKRFSRFSRLTSMAVLLGLIVAALTAFAACGGDDDDDDNDGDTTEATPMAKAGDLKIYDGWARTTTNAVSAAYFTVRNSGLEDTLVKATTNITTTVQLHEVITEGASSKMQEKAGGFPVPANGELTLKPGGYHVMLMDLKGELKEGDTVELELEFAKAGKVKLTLPVKPGPGMAGMGMGMNESMTPGAGMHGMATPAPTAMK
ncbi:MAG: copper chaperone PCu(A)C [Dehalococcoidia bacterium]|uniref:copper chaperone PCu(A)C n=1 Tax=Candidatus Amarobacter glycogenicus TaxID=3140699 RepID=UPI0031349809|nr:copper chaperone PCu(A)C [Dehalococcoidia bacterium]